MTFANAVNQASMRGKTVTENGMVTRTSSTSAVVDLFFQIGALRGQDVIVPFSKAFQSSEDLALRIALWARDAREGAGERQLFKDILVWLEQHRPDILLYTKLIDKVPEVGRWDDLLVLGKYDAHVKLKVANTIKEALAEGNGLCAKWMPRKGEWAIYLRNIMEMTPKQYRKTLVGLTNVVETLMCSNNWREIELKKVPGMAMSRYAQAFARHIPANFSSFKEKVAKGEEKVNVGALYPHDVVRSIFKGDSELANLQWDALPNFVGDANILAMADVSGSMASPIFDKSGLCPMTVSVSLALYTAMKNKGAFKHLFLTFSGNPIMQVLHSKNLKQAVNQIQAADWEMNTDLNRAVQLILDIAVNGKVKKEDMPKMLLILSDMQFDACANFSAYKLLKTRYAEAGYELPKIVFWNLAAKAGVPVKFTKEGVALVSGFSPSILKSLLSSDLNKFSPETVMLETIIKDRYAV